MVISRGEIWWADLPAPTGSEPGYKRPVLVVQSDSFNKSPIDTVIVLTLSTNLALADAPGNILLSTRQSGLPKKSVVNVSQIVAADKSFLTEKVKKVEESIINEVEEGLRLVLALR